MRVQDRVEGEGSEAVACLVVGGEGKLVLRWGGRRRGRMRCARWTGGGSGSGCGSGRVGEGEWGAYPRTRQQLGDLEEREDVEE